MAKQMDTISSVTAVLLLTLHITASAKQSARPVHEVIEVINEQARIDEKPRNVSPGSLPYGNPLAGNIKQNIRLHAHNQQAMFNAERMRQHKAQLQRWTKAPQLIDSYMKAYHESQENHQLALEQQQATLTDAPVTKVPRRRGSPKPKTRQDPRQETLKSGISPLQSEPIKITKADAVIKTQRNRNHRSYGSVEHQQYLQPKKYKTVYISPASAYDQGVTIKPNGNAGFTHLLDEKQNNLYTQAVPSISKYAYPKHFPQMQSSVQDINTLNSLLKKNPHEQLSEFNALLSSTQENTEESDKNNLDTPIDLYFYLKDPSIQSLSQHYDSLKYAQIPTTYAAAYLNDINALRDHTPITEEVDDIEDMSQVYKPKYAAPVTPTPDLGTTTTKSNNYYKVEVASQTISTGHTQKGNEEFYAKGNDEKHAYEAVYGQQPTYYVQDTKQGDTSERYLHHNAQHSGVQHLTEDGVGVSAYGDDSVSMRTYEFKVVTNISIAVPVHKRNRRDVLETEPFLLPNETHALTEMPGILSGNDTNDDPKTDSLIRIPLANKNRMTDFNLFVSNPNFPVGETVDYNYNDYDEIPLTLKRPANHKFEVTYEDDDYNNYGDDFSSPDYEVGNFKPSFPIPTTNPIQNYAPSANYAQNPDLKGSFSSKFGQFKRYPTIAPGLSQVYGVQNYGLPPATSYGVPQGYTVPSVYGTGQNYGTSVRYVNELTNIDNILEPVYMLTQSQLQNLIGHHNLNIEHLDVYQLSKDKRPAHYPRKYRKRYPYRNRHIKKNLHKLHKLNVV